MPLLNMMRFDDAHHHEDRWAILVARTVENLRRQQEEQQDPSSSSSGGDEASQGNPGMRVVETIYFYGGIFAVLFIIFNLIRNRFRRLYSPRQEVAPCELAGRRWSPFAWMGTVSKFTYDELVDQARIDVDVDIMIHTVVLTRAFFYFVLTSCMYVCMYIAVCAVASPWLGQQRLVKSFSKNEKI
jgi:hypothetical protein